MGYLDEYSFKSKLHRWRFDLKTGKTSERHLDDRILEFGMINARFAGRPYRYGYSTLAVPGWFLFRGFVKHDLKTGESWSYELGEGRYAAKRRSRRGSAASEEDDGYLVSFVTDENAGTLGMRAARCPPHPGRPGLPHRPARTSCAAGTHSVWADRAFIRDGYLPSP